MRGVMGRELTRDQSAFSNLSRTGSIMDWNTHLLFLHILLLVFWLGTDIGVFVIGKFVQRPKYSVDQRLLLIQVLLIIDMFPRICMVLMVPTGYQLAVNLGAISAPLYLTLGIWLFSGLWLAVVLTGLLRSEQAVGQKAKKIERIIHYTLIFGAGWVALASIFYGAPIAEYWVAEKIVVFILIIISVIMLEKAFMPAAVGFMQLESDGSSEKLEELIHNGMNRTYLWVIVIYVLVTHSAWLGVFHANS